MPRVGEAPGGPSGGGIGSRRIGLLVRILLLLAVLPLAAAFTGGVASFTYDLTAPTHQHTSRFERDAPADEHVLVESALQRAGSHGHRRDLRVT